MNETKNYSITKSGAVILEGGANRGVFTAGALDFLMEQEYYIPHVIGVSAGACNALDYVSSLSQPAHTSAAMQNTYQNQMEKPHTDTVRTPYPCRAVLFSQRLS